MPIWLLILLLALGGWLGWEAWRGLARGEVWNFLNQSRRSYVDRAARPLLFWIVWAIVAVAGAYLILFTLALAFVYGLKPLGGA